MKVKDFLSDLQDTGLSVGFEEGDPEEASFYFWLSGSKEWVKRYGINAVIEMMMQENYTTESYDVE